jgi:hypothetical protein
MIAAAVVVVGLVLLVLGLAFALSPGRQTASHYRSGLRLHRLLFPTSRPTDDCGIY